MLLGSPATFTPVLVACYAITVALHVASIGLSTLLPFQMVALGTYYLASSVGIALAPPVAFGLQAFGVCRWPSP